MNRRRRSPAERRVVLRRCETAAEAEVWADAYRSVLASLDIAAWWRVRIDPAEAGALNVGVDYSRHAEPSSHQMAAYPQVGDARSHAR